jgi:hypothetical protein
MFPDLAARDALLAASALRARRARRCVSLPASILSQNMREDWAMPSQCHGSPAHVSRTVEASGANDRGRQARGLAVAGENESCRSRQNLRPATVRRRLSRRVGDLVTRR